MISLSNITVKAKIYESANSIVYRGVKKPSNKDVILKVLKQDYPSPSERTSYKSEYEIIRSLNIEGVIRAESIQEYQRTLVIILEDFGGESIKKWMQLSPQKYNPIPIAEFLPLAIQITNILGKIHTANIIHKDINPSNIVLNPEAGIVKIIDFGIATRLPRINPTFKSLNVLEGTLAYISPEQTGRMNCLLDYRTDFYSLGVTFYEMLTGQLPFPTTDVLELVHCHLAVQPVLPHEINPQIPPGVSNIVIKLMSKNAEERYQSAWGIQVDLEQCLAQLQTSGNISEFPLATHDISEKFQIPQKLYGREAEVAALLTAFERVAGKKNEVDKKVNSSLSTFSPHSQSNVELMLVAGYSGIGKSALVQEIYRPITLHGYFISGKFDQFQQNIPYSAVVSAFQKLVKQLLTETATKLEQWRKKILEAVGTNGQVIIDVIPEMELIVGSQPALPEVGLTEAQNRFHRVFQNFLRVFCAQEHPLVIFLDDLQWVDNATLKLIELMMTDTDTQYLFLIGAYRDNEVGSTHPLMRTLEKLKQQQATINSIILSPLEIEPITQLIADTLHSDLNAVKPLAELIMRKTHGNPFFVSEFLKTLYTENLITLNFPSSLPSLIPEQNNKIKWNWNLAQIEARDITDNVVELMISRLKKLPKSIQQVLQLAACVGADFDLNTVSIICEKSPVEIFPDLVTALESGLILSSSELDNNLLIQNYKFLHDRVQQAAYALIDESQKAIIHWQIGRNLLQRITPENLLEKLFEIVDHLNIGVIGAYHDIFITQQERDEIAKLNLMAGQKAKVATAYTAAKKYLTTGIELLAPNSFEYEYDLSLTLYTAAAEVAYLCGNFEEMEKWVTVVLQKAKSLLDKIKIYEIKIQTCTAQIQLVEAVKMGLEVLEMLDISLPHSPTEVDIQQALEKTTACLIGKNIQDLVNLPTLTDTDRLAAMCILSKIASPAYGSAPRLLPLIACENVNLSIKYGNAPFSAFGFATYAIILNGVVQDLEGAYQFGCLSLSLVERFKTNSLKCKIFFIFGAFLMHGKVHLRETFPIFQEAYQSGIENGDFEYASYSAQSEFVNSYFSGLELTLLEQNMKTLTSSLSQLKQEIAVIYYQIYQQAVFNLLGRVQNPCQLIGEAYNEEKSLPLHQKVNDRTGLFFVYLNKIILCYLFGEITQALENAALAELYLDGVMAQVCTPTFNFYDSLTRLMVYPSLTISEQQHFLLKVNNNQEKLQKLALSAPMNFQHKYELVEAEKAKVLGHILDAEDLYEQAIKGANEHGYIQEEALAYELAAKFYLGRGREKIAQTYMKEAHYCYMRWGATAKVQDLEEKYPYLLTQLQTGIHTKKQDITSSTTTTGKSSTEALDLATIMKASHAISGEIVLDKLLEKLLQILIENAGAQKVFLILRSQETKNEGEWVIEALGEVNSKTGGDEIVETTVLQTKILQSIPIHNLLPESIINYVIHTKESIVLNDAIESHFSNEPYIQQHQTKSILCTPLLNQGKLVGIVYLENNLSAGAFTAERLEVLNLLSLQAAIAIENAKLYFEVTASEKELRASESRLTQFLEAMPVGIAMLDASGKPYYANSRAVQLLGKGVIPQVTSAEIPDVYQVYLSGTNQKYPSEKLPIVRAWRGERTTADDLEIHQGDTIIPIEAWGVPIFNENGKVAYGLVVFQDITQRKQAEKLLADYNHTLEQQVAKRTLELQREIKERKRAEEVAQAANKAKSIFLANMSHELRTPLNAILGFSQLVSHASSIPSEQQENLKIIMRNGEHLLTLINQVLDLSKIEAGRTTLNPINFNLHCLLDDLEDMFRLKADNKGLELVFHRTKDVPQYVHSDEVKLRQVLINLLSNAIKFTKEGRVSLIVTKRPGDKLLISSPAPSSPHTLCFEVADTGTGIAAHELESIFEAFVQTQTGQQVQEGTGLGLTIARSFVQLMGGDISVSSVVGKGSIFRFDISVPVVSPTSIHQTSTRRVVALEPKQPCYRILVVDDRWDNRRLLMRLLSPIGFELLEASTAHQALTIWESWQPHLIFMDMRMPDMNGLEIVKRIKASPKGQNTVIIALTAHVLQEKQTIFLSVGCDDYICKPFREEDIFGAIHKHLGVRFIYDESAFSTITNKTRINVLTNTVLATLPSDLVIALYEAIIALDVELIKSFITQIHQFNQPIANVFSSLADNFQYEQLLDLIQLSIDGK